MVTHCSCWCPQCINCAGTGVQRTLSATTIYDHITQNTNSSWSRPISEMEINSSFTQPFGSETLLHTLTVKLKILQPIHKLMKVYKLFSLRLWSYGVIMQCNFIANCRGTQWLQIQGTSPLKLEVTVSSEMLVTFYKTTRSLNAKNKLLLFTTTKTSISSYVSFITVWFTL